MTYFLGCLLVTFVLVAYGSISNLLYMCLRMKRLKEWQILLLEILAMFIALIAMQMIMWFGLLPVRGV